MLYERFKTFKKYKSEKAILNYSILLFINNEKNKCH